MSFPVYLLLIIFARFLFTSGPVLSVQSYSCSISLSSSSSSSDSLLYVPKISMRSGSLSFPLSVFAFPVELQSAFFFFDAA